MEVGGSEELDFVDDFALDEGKLDKAPSGKRPFTEGEGGGEGFLRVRPRSPAAHCPALGAVEAREECACR